MFVQCSWSLLYNQSYPALFRPLFVASGKPKLTTDIVAATFQVQWSPQDSSQREAEEAVVFEWIEYFQDVMGNLYLHEAYRIKSGTSPVHPTQQDLASAFHVNRR